MGDPIVITAGPISITVNGSELEIRTLADEYGVARIELVDFMTIMAMVRAATHWQ